MVFRTKAHFFPEIHFSWLNIDHKKTGDLLCQQATLPSLNQVQEGTIYFIFSADDAGKDNEFLQLPVTWVL